MEYYSHLIVDRLQLSPAFFKREEKRLVQKLQFGREALRQEWSDIFAMNQFLAVAASVVRASPHINEALASIRQSNIPGDPVTPLVAATLYYILNNIPDPATQGRAPQTEEWYDIKKRFAEMNWLVGTEDMKQLGFNAPPPETDTAQVPERNTKSTTLTGLGLS